MDNENYLEIILNKFRDIKSSKEKRISIFNFIRDIPYEVSGTQDPEDLIKNNKGDCAAKAKLLSLLMNKLGYQTRFLLIKYKLRDFPKEVKYIPHQIDYHHAIEIKINKKWKILDATYDLPLKNHGFKVNFWDGINNTDLAEEPLEIKRSDEKNKEFDRRFSTFIEELNLSIQKNSRKIKEYTKKYNQIISVLRDKSKVIK